MKKFLSLVLALVMTMSLVTISSGAAFTDAASITYKEAVDVMTAVKVVDGDTDGSFRPTDTLTRGAAAKIICNLILGPTVAGALKADAAPYPDVATDNVFAGYIAFCKQQGIISGYADGTFKPANSLTGYAFMKMLLGALGYSADVEGYSEPNWSINVAKRALALGLNAGLKGDFVGNKAVTREEALLYAFNTMKSTMVEYDTTIVVGNVVIAGSKAETVANWTKTDGYIANDDEMQFAEKYFTNLKAVATTDGMMRPATQWLLKRDAIGTYTVEADYETYVTAAAGTLAAAIDSVSKSFNETAAVIYVNGVQNQNYVAKRGDKVELYMNADAASMIDRIVITTTTVQKATAAATKTVVGDVTYIDIAGTDITAVKSTELVGYEAVKAGDVIMTYVDKNGVKYIDIAESFNATMTATTANAGETALTTPATYTIGGVVYYESQQTGTIATATLIGFKSDAAATYWLDDAGHIIWATGTPAAPIKVMQVLKNHTYTAGNVFVGDTLKSQVVFAEDAKTEIIDVAKVGTTAASNSNAPKMLDSYDADTKLFTDNGNLASIALYSYTVADGKYTVTELTTAYETGVAGYAPVGSGTAGTAGAGDKIVKGIPSAFGTAYTDIFVTDSETVYLLRDASTTSVPYADTYTKYVGFANVPSMTIYENGAEAYVGADGVAQYIFINNYTLTEAAASDDIYVLASTVTAHYKADKTVDYFTAAAIVDGVSTTVKIANGAAVQTTDAATVITPATLSETSNPLKDHTLYIITAYDAAGNIAAMAEAVSSAPNAGKYYWVGLVGSQAAKNDKIVLNTAASAISFAYAEDAVVYTISATGDVVTTGTIASLITDANDKIAVAVAGATYGTAANNTVKEIYVYKQNPDAPAATPEAPANTGIAVYVKSNNSVQVFYKASEGITNTQVLNAVKDTILAKGYESVVANSFDGTTYKWNAYDEAGFKYEYTWNATNDKTTTAAMVLDPGQSVTTTSGHVIKNTGSGALAIVNNGGNFYTFVGSIVIADSTGTALITSTDKLNTTVGNLVL